MVWEWLQQEATLIEILYIVPIVLIIKLAITYIAHLIKTKIFKHKCPTYIEPERPPITKVQGFPDLIAFLVILFLFAGAEELFCRLVPIWLTLKICGESFFALIIVAIVSSIIFGLVHCRYCGPFEHGIAGFIYCIIFLKCGGLDGYFLKAILVTTTIHAIFNFILVMTRFPDFDKKRLFQPKNRPALSRKERDGFLNSGQPR